MKESSSIFYTSLTVLTDITIQMPQTKRQTAEGGGRPNKRQRGDQTSGPALKTDSVPRGKGKYRCGISII